MAPKQKKMTEINFGEIGQKISIKSNDYYIGDVVMLTDKKTNVKKYFQIIYNEYTFQLDLFNKNNALASVHPSGSYWHTQAFIPLCKIINGNIPYIEITRIGNDKSALKLIKRISRTSMKPSK